jgi:hypothetical protein
VPRFHRAKADKGHWTGDEKRVLFLKGGTKPPGVHKKTKHLYFADQFCEFRRGVAQAPQTTMLVRRVAARTPTCSRITPTPSWVSIRTSPSSSRVSSSFRPTAGNLRRVNSRALGQNSFTKLVASAPCCWRGGPLGRWTASTTKSARSASPLRPTLLPARERGPSFTLPEEGRQAPAIAHPVKILILTRIL